ncbi:MAG: tRNA dihydrouridine synthase DusB [Proteobacteria bacterium]|nr:tRNA dihydrouridine synthase DusB [Pseudomonadota bacterium]
MPTTLSIGPYELRSRILLAPMAGLTDAPFRQIAWECGAGYVVSEMVSAKPQLWNSAKSRSRRVVVEGIDPVAVQIAGSDPVQMAQAAQRHVADGAQIIDINFGCPAKKVCRKLAGSALLSDPGLVEDIVSAVVASVPVPVTVKMRTGPDRINSVAPHIARRIEAAGAASIVIHGRSRACRFNGSADHRCTAQVRQLVNIPVIANGDIVSVADAEQVLRETDASGLMIGRGAIGAPWMLGEMAGRLAPGRDVRWRIVLRHLDLIYAFYGSEQGVRISRKHLLAYLTGFGFDRAVIRHVITAVSAEQQRDAVVRLRNQTGVAAQAA